MTAHEKQLINLARRLVSTAFAAVDAQQKADYWDQFGTDTPTQRRANDRREEKLQSLERLDRELVDLIAAVEGEKP